MSMRKAIEVVAALASKGVVQSYAITGAVGALAYDIEPAMTQDVDILVQISDFEQRKSGLILLTPIEKALAEMGYAERSDVGILVEGWPLQFIPVSSELDEESLRLAEETELEGEPALKVRVLRPEHLVAKAASLGRLKDLARIEAILDHGAVDLSALKSVIERFDLLGPWQAFCSKAGRTDPLGLV